MSEQVTDTTHDDAEVTTEHPDDEEAVDTSHLDDMDDGCGCAEVWEHLSDNRDGEADTDD